MNENSLPWSELLEQIPDCGNAGAVDTRRSAQMNMTIAASTAETSTLRAPDRAGQLLLLVAGTVGGSGTRAITASAAINQAGNNVMTFNAARDYILLVGAKVAGTGRWLVVANDGVALSTV